MTTAIVRKEWNSLIEVNHGPCASLYVALEPVGREGMGDPLRLKKVADSAVQQLLDRGYETETVAKLLKPAYDLPGTAAWKSRGKGLAILLGPQAERIFNVEQPLQDEAWGDKHLHVRPLLPLVVESDEFYLLALSENHAQLYRGDARELEPLAVAGMPKNLDDALRIENPDRGSQTHSALAGGHGRSGAIFHGHGGEADTAKISRLEYMRRVYAAVERQWKRHQLPIVLAMVSEDVPDWRKLAHSVKTLEPFIAGNPDYASMSELQEEACRLVLAEAKAAGESAYDRLCNAKGTPRAVLGLSQVLPAAVAGKVDTLFIDPRTPMSGRFDEASGEVVVQHNVCENRRNDLLEDALRQTVLHGGQVFALETSGELPVSCEALLRY
jgi:hypothetical protein